MGLPDGYGRIGPSVAGRRQAFPRDRIATFAIAPPLAVHVATVFRSPPDVTLQALYPPNIVAITHPRNAVGDRVGG